MKIISWNIQAAKGVDEVVSVDRIAQVIKDLGDADIICCQEVLNCELNRVESNQVQALAAHFPEYQVYFGAAIDRLQTNTHNADARLQFGNLILSRVPVLQHSLHRLPQPAEAGIPCMPRQAIELLVPYADQILRIVTTHLDYFAATQRTDQVRYLRHLNEQTLDRSTSPGAQGGEMQFAALAETDLAVFCGDFNMEIDSEDYQILTSRTPQSAGAEMFDCWRLQNPDQQHAPTCGIFDRVQWSEGPHCRDFFFASAALANSVVAVTVDTDTDASDHQPLMLTLA